MSLISRIEVTNYLTEGINTNRRVADWRPMLTGITLRMDGGKSTLVNITNGGGKTSLMELLMYVLSRDPRLLKVIRGKLSPKSRGYTHARIEFRDIPDDNYQSPSLLEIDPENLAGETHVVGVALTDDVNDTPIFYGYSGTLEDSPCYLNDGRKLTNISDTEFTNKTRSMPGCKWNKFNSRKEWEVHINQFISIEVVRRNVIYQLNGSDDKNASFFNFTPRGGETYDSAFFRSVVAPDLLTNLLNSFSDEGELNVEDTLHKSLSRIVAAEKEVQRKEKHLGLRQAGLNRMQPILQAGEVVNGLQQEMIGVLRSFRKDVALIDYFGGQGLSTTMPGLPRSPKTIPKTAEQYPRLMQALKGMVITPDEGILILDKTMSELSGVDVGRMREIAERKQISTHLLKSQVIDFNCVFDTFGSGGKGGGHQRKGYSRSAATAILPLLIGTTGATIDGLENVLNQAFNIAESQLDTNPSAIEIRRLEGLCQTTQLAIDNATTQADELTVTIGQLHSQLTDRQDNQAAWDDFVKIGHLLPVELKDSPSGANKWLSKRIKEIKDEQTQRNIRSGKLDQAWENYIAVIERAGLEGIDGIRARAAELAHRQNTIQESKKRIAKDLSDMRATDKRLRKSLTTDLEKANTQATHLNKFEAHYAGYLTFRQVFGDVFPKDVNPQGEDDKAKKNLNNKQAELIPLKDELNELVRLRSQAGSFVAIFGENVDPLQCDPVEDDRKLAYIESVARQNIALWTEKAEALDRFEEMAPGMDPATWIKQTDERRGTIEAEQSTTQVTKTKAEQEIIAIEHLRVVDDGAYHQAWALFDAQGVKAQRLHSVILTADKTMDERSAALSALSGMLSAPVFNTIKDLESAATLLGSSGVAVPLVHKPALLDAINQSITSHGDVRMFGFIGGNYSRRVRILLEPAYAQQELEHFKKQVQACDASLQQISKELPVLLTTSADYQLAQRAQEAHAKDARARYATFINEANQVSHRRSELAPQLTKSAREVLRCAALFIQKGGSARVMALDANLLRLDAAIVELKLLYDAAHERATYENRDAHSHALQYVELGGETKHEQIKTTHKQALEAQEIAQGLVDENSEAMDRLSGESDKVQENANAFETEQGHLELDRYSRAITMADAADDKVFMETFSSIQQALSDEENTLTSCLSVSFGRAEAFKAHMNESDQILLGKLATAKQEHSSHAAFISTSEANLKRIRQAEIPAWLKIRQAVHELAWELGRRVAITRTAASDMNSLEEGQAVPESHALFPQMDTILGHFRLQSKDSSGLFVGKINDAIYAVQALDVEQVMREFKDVSRRYNDASSAYTDKNKAFCTEAREDANSRVSAFNLLEIEEIERATPARLQALGELFNRMNDSLERERQEAIRAKAVAEEANKDSVNQLSGLIRIAEDNLTVLEKVMAKYPHGRFFVEADIAGEDRIREILSDLKEEVERASRELETAGRSRRGSDETRIKQILRDTLIERLFMNTRVSFVNGGIWSGKRNAVTHILSTGQKIALEFMWIVRQAEYEIERGLRELTSKQAARSRALTNRVIMIDGIFSTLSDRTIIKEALNGLRGLGGNFQIIGFLHSPTWTNDSEVFPVYHVGKKLSSSAGHGLVSFTKEGGEAGTIGFFSSIAQRPPSGGALAS